MKLLSLCRLLPLPCLAAAAALHAAPAIPNPSFEANGASFTTSPGYIQGNTTITGWTASDASRVGINSSAGPFADNGTIPDGSYVALIQTVGPAVSLSTTITGLTVGATYQLQFQANRRGVYDSPQPTVRVNNGTALPFSVEPSGAYRSITVQFIAFAATAPLVISNSITSGDATVLVDNFTITVVPQTFVVTSTNDSGPGSLRQAFIDAAAHPGPDNIVFSPAMGGRTITLQSEIGVVDTDGVTLDGSGLPSMVTLSGDEADATYNRIFTIATGSTVSLTNVIFIGGVVHDASFNGSYGGALLSGGTLSVTNCLFIGNAATGSSGLGGAICSLGGTLAVTGCTFSQNSADGGGAIYTEAVATVTGCTFTGNTATEYASAIADGASSPLALNITSSTFNNNQAGKGGTITGGDGTQVINLTHCTIAGNRSLMAGGGGGLDVTGGTQVTLKDTILAGNTAMGALLNYGDSSGTFPALVGNNHNLSDDTPKGFTGTDIVNSKTIGLLPLASNGGPTQTMALPFISPAANGAAGSTITADQRGLPVVGVPDIGAYEVQPMTFSLSASSYPAVAGYPLKVTIVRSQNLQDTATVRLTTLTGGANGSAGTADFTARPNTTASDVTFGEGEASKEVVITIAKSTSVLNKTFTLSLSLPIPAALASLSAPVSATVTITPSASLQVTTINDDGPGSLRQALATASTAAASVAQVITFAPALNGRTISLAGEMLISAAAPLTLDASALPAGVTVDAGPQGNRLFYVFGGTSLTLKRLTLINGSGSGALKLGHGGALVVDVGGSVTMSECSLNNNHSSANHLGGAIYNLGTITLMKCTLMGNYSDNGGAIDNHQDASLIQCTLYGNRARLTGGAIESSASGSLLLRHCTIAGNTIYGSGGVGGGGGGGLFLDGTNPLTLEDSIIYGNTGQNGSDIFNHGQAITLAGTNLVGSLNDSNGGTATGLGTIGRGDPILAPPASNGGPTQTMALGGGSAAINAATGSAVAADQRGLPIIVQADIGAFEVQKGGVFTLAQPSYLAPSGNVLSVTVLRSVAFEGPASVKFSTKPGTAASTAFTAINNQVVSFADGETFKTVPVTIAGDSVLKPNKTFGLGLASPSAGCTLGSPATATVVITTGDGTDSTAPPAPVITSPAANALVNVPVGGRLTLTGTATDDKDVTFITISDGAGNFLTNATLSAPDAAATGWTAWVPATAGANTYKVTTSDFFANTSPAAIRTVIVLRPLGVSISGYGSVTAGYAPSSYRHVGQPQSITATPGPGWIFGGWFIVSSSGGISASNPLLPTLTFVHQEGLVLLAVFAPSPYTTANTGVFNGGIDPSSSVPAGGTVPGLSSVGYASVTVQTNGSFTAALKLDGTSYPVTGAFDAGGIARFGTTGSAVFTIARKNLPSLLVSLSIDIDNGIVSGNVSAFDGSVITASSIITAERCPFSAGSPVAPGLLGPASGDALYAIIMPAITGQTIGDANYPHGTGYASMKLTKTGAVTVSAVLADGTSFTESTALSGASHWRLFASPYGGKGLVAGNAAFGPSNYDFLALSSTWIRPVMDTQYYPGGWAGGISLNVAGAKYTVTSGQSVLPGLDVAGDAELDFSGAGLSSTLRDTFTTTGADVIHNTANDVSYKLTINRATGIFTGSFTAPDGSKPVFNGVVLTKSLSSQSAGFFLTPAPKVKDYTGQSGNVILSATP